jgi:phosphate transport system permease protein
LSPSRIDAAATPLLGVSALAAGSLVILILGFMVVETIPALTEIGPARFLGDASWQPTDGAEAAYGIVPMVVGSLLVTVLSMTLALPLGLLAALFLRFYAPPWIASIFRRLIELLAGIPSVVFGFWGLVSLVPLINAWRAPGQSLLAGGVVLFLMVLPTVALTAEAAIRSVSPELTTAAASLGLGRWATISGVVLPAARAGIIGGALLAAARAVGETMAVVMVCGNVVQVPGSLFDPLRTVTANIALEMGYATSLHRSALFLSGLALLLLIGGALLVIEVLRKESRRG